MYADILGLRFWKEGSGRPFPLNLAKGPRKPLPECPKCERGNFAEVYADILGLPFGKYVLLVLGL